MTERTCTKCGLAKPTEAFYSYSSGRAGCRSECSLCMRAAQALRPRKNCAPAKKAEYNRRDGRVTVAYVPASVRTARRAAVRADCVAHVKAWRRRAARAQAFHESCGAHVLWWRRAKDSADFRERYRNDSAFALAERIRNQIRKKAKRFPRLGDQMRDAINRGGNSPMVERVCGWTIQQLVAHLEALFTEGMSWAAFGRGEIHIDHRRPQAAFDLNDESQVRACWALSNLQPLWAADNRAKSDLVDGAPARCSRSGVGARRSRLPPNDFVAREIAHPDVFAAEGGKKVSALVSAHG